MSYTYVKKSIPGNYVTLDELLDNRSYNNIGNSYYHYCNNWWVALTEDQCKFHLDNPSASVKEVLEMKLEIIPDADPLIEAKNKLLKDIQDYDISSDVNNFVVNGNINLWFTVQERLNYKQSVEAAKILGEEDVEFLIGNQEFMVPTQMAEKMLAQIQRYADKCYITTSRHIQNANNLKTLEEVNSYNYKINYPKMLEFNLS